MPTTQINVRIKSFHPSLSRRSANWVTPAQFSLLSAVSLIIHIQKRRNVISASPSEGRGLLHVGNDITDDFLGAPLTHVEKQDNFLRTEFTITKLRARVEFGWSHVTSRQSASAILYRGVIVLWPSSAFRNKHYSIAFIQMHRKVIK